MAQKPIKLGGSVDNERAQKTRALFERYYDNKIAVISLEQQGDYGKTVHISARTKLVGMNRKTLRFYSFDSKNGTFVFLNPQPRFWFDPVTGYLDFDTYYAGDIVVTDRPLTKKGGVDSKV